MATTYTWTVNQMYTLQQPDPNYVVNVLWTLTGVDGTTTASIGGNSPFDSNQSGTFIPYDQLTEAIVIGWVQAQLGEVGVSNFEANVQGQINSILNPPVSPQNTPLPWATPAA
jgi:hypothetical protein